MHKKENHFMANKAGLEEKLYDESIQLWTSDELSA
jgi:hypothetical protein